MWFNYDIIHTHSPQNYLLGLIKYKCFVRETMTGLIYHTKSNTFNTSNKSNTL